MSDFLFSGLKVIDAATVIAGPAAAMMMADFGADVIKIEQPGRGDMLRVLSSMPDVDPSAQGYMWEMDGRNKRGIALDLKSKNGLKVLHELAAGCDVFITNMPYANRERFSLCYENLQPQNPSMIYVSLTAYGELGEERARKGFDQLAYWARSGLMDLMREHETIPAQGLPGMGDHPTAVTIYAGIVTALLQRERSGEGSFVQTSLLANGLWSNAAIAQGVFAGGDMSRYRAAAAIEGFQMRVYRTKDDRWLQFNMVRNDELLDRLLSVLGAADLLLDERFQTRRDRYINREVLGELLQERVLQKTSDEWMTLFTEYELPVNRIAEVEDLPADTQVKLNRMTRRALDEDRNLELVNHPVQVSSVRHVEYKRGPNLGEHTREILSELGYSATAIESLIDEGAVGALEKFT